MAVTAADVPGRYDLVINDGTNTRGYTFLRTLDGSYLSANRHRAEYTSTATFVERQNISNAYGDNAQDFFLTARNRDWSLGEQQKFFRSSQDGRYWMGQSIDVSTPGQVNLSQSVNTITLPAAVAGVARSGQNDNIVTASATNLYTVDPSGTITDLGAHGLGAAPGKYGICTDGTHIYLSTTTAGTVGIRRYVLGGAFSTFSASAFDSLAFLNNTLYGFNSVATALYSIDTAGTVTSIFPWKTATGGVAGFAIPRLHAFGGKLLISSRYAQESSELWIYDGSGASRLEVFPENFEANDLEVLYGVAYIAGAFIRQTAGAYYSKPAVLFWDGSNVGKLWEANAYNTSSLGSAGNLAAAPYPSIGVNNGTIVFPDDTTGNLMKYDPGRGGVSSVAALSATGTNCATASAISFTLQTRSQTDAYIFPSGTYPTSGYVISSLIDFESSLSKQFRGVKVDFDAAADGNGGTVDIAYQVDSLSGSWTTLRTGAVSGTEYTFTNISGHAVAIKVTLNKGTSTAGPTLKSLNVRAAPVLQSFNVRTYNIDLSSLPSVATILEDGTPHPLTGFDQAVNLRAAISSTVPLTITDKFGTFTGICEPSNCSILELHSDESAGLTHPGQFIGQITVREV
jgi:hypothetical protein